jgi:chaperonin cofactor prefoldin
MKRNDEEELARVRLQLGQAEEQRDAAMYELAEFKKMLAERVPGDDATWILKSWSNCLGNMLYPKSHWIDALAKTTRLLNSDKRAAEGQRDALQLECNQLKAELEKYAKAPAKKARAG